MRLFQTSDLYPSYLTELRKLRGEASTFADLHRVMVDDRYAASHVLQPALSGDPSAFYTNHNDEVLQRAWAREQGMPADRSLEQILLAQIEHHRTEVFYNCDPVGYDSAFVKKLPASVKVRLCWRAAPLAGADFSAYQTVLNNYPEIQRMWRDKGWRSDYFYPAHDPEMDAYAANRERPIDVLFVGTYSRHHRTRAVVLEAVTELRKRWNVKFAIQQSRLTRLAETPLGLVPPLRKHRYPAGVRAIATNPVFGRAYYDLVSRAKVMLNGRIDMTGPDRGNMRCWETLGCRTLMVSDAGNYPQGMVAGETLLTYETPEEAVQLIERGLTDADWAARIADRGYDMIRTRYTKRDQWQRFEQIVASL